MAQQSYDKECIDLTQLETALRLFDEGQDFFSVVTLAGAADELLGKLVRARGGKTSLESLTSASAATDARSRPVAAPSHNPAGLSSIRDRI